VLTTEEDPRHQAFSNKVGGPRGERRRKKTLLLRGRRKDWGAEGGLLKRTDQERSFAGSRSALNKTGQEKGGGTRLEGMPEQIKSP